MIIIYTRRVWSQIVDLLKQFHARGRSWKQQETDCEKLWWEIRVWSPSGDVWSPGAGAWYHDEGWRVSLRCISAGQLPGKMARCPDNKLWWRRKLLTWNIQLIHALFVEYELKDDTMSEREQTPCIVTTCCDCVSLLHSWYGSRVRPCKGFLYAALHVSPLLYFSSENTEVRIHEFNSPQTRGTMPQVSGPGEGRCPGVGVMFAELIVHRWTCDYLDHLPR